MSAARGHARVDLCIDKVKLGSRGSQGTVLASPVTS